MTHSPEVLRIRPPRDRVLVQMLPPKPRLESALIVEPKRTYAYHEAARAIVVRVPDEPICRTTRKGKRIPLPDQPEVSTTVYLDHGLGPEAGWPVHEETGRNGLDGAKYHIIDASDIAGVCEP